MRLLYKQWLEQVDRELEKICGLDQGSLPDWLARDAFDDGLTPKEAAIECLESAGVDYERVLDEA